MSLQADHLSALTERHPECRQAAYADIETGVVLLVCGSDADLTREHVDRLCAEASVCLGDPDGPSLGTSVCNEALTASVDEIHVYLRAPDNPGEAYLFQCATALDVAAFLEDARAEIAIGI